MVNKRNLKAVYRTIIDKKGFTMVELIVVLVVLAILAGATVPALLGFTDSAKKKQYIAEGKTALTAAQSMLNDVYVDNLAYVPKSMRDEAFKTTGLPEGTEFTIYTVNPFKGSVSTKAADGTLDTIGCYTIASALYKAKDGTYIEYDGKDWDAVDEKAYDTGNYIRVWPVDDEKISDTAGNVEYIADGEETTEIDIKQDEDDYQEDVDDKEPGNPMTDQKLQVELIVGESFGVVPMVFSSNGKSRYMTIFSSGNFDEEKPLQNPDRFINENGKDYSDYFDAGTLKWFGPGLPDGGTLTDMKAYIGNNGESAYGSTWTYTAVVDEKKIPIPAKFEAFSDDTMTVSFTGASAKGTVDFLYGMMSEGVELASSSYTVSASTKVPTGENENSNAITFSENWAMKTGSSYLEDSRSVDGYSWTTDSGSDGKSDFSEGIKKFANSLIKSESSVSNAVTKMKAGVTFVAVADLNKTIYIRGKLDSSEQLVGDIRFVKNNVDFYDISMSFTKNELTEKIYDLENGVKNHLVDLSGQQGTYSVFATNGYEIEKNARTIKFWNIFDCQKGGKSTIGLVRNARTRGEDCSEYLLDYLYSDRENDSYGEVVVADISDYTTKIETELESGCTNLREAFSYLAHGSVNKITSIIYVPGTVVPNKDDVDREMCISVTPVADKVGEKYPRENNKYVVIDSQRVEDYPAYTVAYSVKNTINGTDYYDIYVITEDGTDIIVDGKDDNSATLKGMCSGFSGMNNITLFTGLVESGVTDMSSMFSGCTGLTSLNLGNLDTSTVTNMSGMFNGCTGLTSLNLENFNTSAVTDMSSMFNGCTGLTSLNLESFATTAVTDMSSMFNGCTNLEGTLDISSFNTANVTTMASMFKSCSSIEHINVNKETFVGDNLVYANSMFEECNSLISLDLRGFKTCEGLTTIESWFKNCYKLKFIDLSNFIPTTSLNNVRCAFYHLGDYDGSDTNYNIDQAHDGCAIFASGTWNTSATREPKANDRLKYDYCFRIDLYGHIYKDPREAWTDYCGGSGDMRHLSIENESDVGKHVKFDGGDRMRGGYFNSTTSTYYSTCKTRYGYDD